MTPVRVTVGCGFLLALSLGAARAEVRLPAMFSDNMVLQREQAVPVWGWADDGEVVTARFRGQSVVATTANRHWRVALKRLKPGGPDTLSVSSKAGTLQFTNVLVGDVWVCSGQSNMEFPLKNSFEPEADLAAATNAQIRLFNVGKNRLESPTTGIKSTWQTLSPGSVGGFSAVGYYFGRDLQRAQRVPIGLIGTYWGGTPAESWMNREALEINPRYQKEILEAGAASSIAWRKALDAFEREKAEALKAGKPFTKPAPRQPWGGYELYNGMIAPLLPYAIKGAIWYQGESNAGRADQYRTLFPDLIRCWRHEWGADFPFLLVQLAPYTAIKPEPGDSDWAELREAQLLATKVLPKVGMAVITDVGEAQDIHPRHKEPVGARLAVAARAIAYGERLEFSGPVYRSQQTDGSRIILGFDHVGKGLEARDGELKGFAICGEDRKWVWAKADIQGNTVVVSSPDVAKPVAVRYGWASCPVVNFWNLDGLPATPFRTDDFPLTTAPKP